MEAAEQVEEQSLDDLLVEPEVKGEEPEKEPEPEVEEPEKGEEPESPPDSDKDKRDIPIQALLDEREKRQAAQKERDELRAKLASLGKKDDEPGPDVFSDPEGRFAYEREQSQRERQEEKFASSRELMLEFKEDYEQREREFLELAKEDDSLREKLLKHPQPALFAYKTAVKHAKLREMENVDEFRAKLEAEIRQQILKELEAEQAEGAEKANQKRDAITPSLAKGRSAGTEPVVDESLEDILKG